MVEADKGYIGEPAHIRTNRSAHSMADKRAASRARTRHKTINGRLKNWDVLKTPFRNELRKHGACFSACLAITQIQINMGKRPFHCNY
jgi:hypothetical protein